MKAPPAPPGTLAFLWQTLLHDGLLWLLLLVLLCLSLAAPDQIRHYPALVDWPTMATLTGLLILTKGVELSGFLHRLGEHLVARMQTQRTLALCLVGATALLATFLTNDVALFVVVPLTLSLHRLGADVPQQMPPLWLTRLIIFEALAANAGSALTPIGNPQNLYLWQQSHVPFFTFVSSMLALALLLLVPLLLLTACVFPGIPLPVPAPHAAPPVRRPLLLLCLTLYLPFLLLTDLHQAPAALLVLVALFLVTGRQVLARTDWALLLVFVLMFIDLRLIAATAPVRVLFFASDLGQVPHLYLAAIAASQLISNVPATILLAQYSHDWRTLAYGANIGGAGLAIGSLANIIALRMASRRQAWLLFHAYSIPFLLVTGALTYYWLR